MDESRGFVHHARSAVLAYMGVANRDSLARLSKMSEPSSKGSKASDGNKEAFHNKFPELVRELTEDGLKNLEISDGIQHLKEVRCYREPSLAGDKGGVFSLKNFLLQGFMY